MNASIDDLLATILPEGASEAEQADFARGLHLLADLLQETEADAARLEPGDGVPRP